MKNIKFEREEVEMKNVVFENLNFNCMEKYKFMVIEIPSRRSDLCFVSLFERKPFKNKIPGSNDMWQWETLEAIMPAVIAQVDLSDETPERILFLTENVHEI